MLPQVASRASPGISKGTRPKSQLVTPNDPDSEFAYRRVVSHPSLHPTQSCGLGPCPHGHLGPTPMGTPPYQARCPPSLHCTLSTIPASHAIRRLVTLAPSLCHDAVLSVLNVTTRTPVPLGTWPGSYLLRASGGAFFSPASPTDPSPSHPRRSQLLSPGPPHALSPWATAPLCLPSPTPPVPTTLPLRSSQTPDPHLSKEGCPTSTSQAK